MMEHVCRQCGTRPATRWDYLCNECRMKPPLEGIDNLDRLSYNERLADGFARLQVPEDDYNGRRDL